MVSGLSRESAQHAAINMKGQILEWVIIGKPFRRGLFVPGKSPKSLLNQGRALVYMLDENLNIMVDADGKQVLAVVSLKNAKIIGFQD